MLNGHGVAQYQRDKLREARKLLFEDEGAFLAWRRYLIGECSDGVLECLRVVHAPGVEAPTVIPEAGRKIIDGIARTGVHAYFILEQLDDDPFLLVSEWPVTAPGTDPDGYYIFAWDEAGYIPT